MVLNLYYPELLIIISRSGDLSSLSSSYCIFLIKLSFFFNVGISCKDGTYR